MQRRTYDDPSRVLFESLEGNSSVRTEASYGADALLATTVRRSGSGEPSVSRYIWRGLQIVEVRLEPRGSRQLSYDGVGRLVRSTVTDDGLDEAMARHHHDERGRLVRTEWDYWPDGLEDADFAPTRPFASGGRRVRASRSTFRGVRRALIDG